MPRDKHILFVLLLVSTHSLVFAQEEDSVSTNKREILAYSGNVSLRNVFYHVDGIESRRDPFYYLLNANLTFKLFDVIDIPLSATITSKSANASFNKSINQLGISPKYKFITVHAGYRSMEFSPFTYSGLIFLGGGIEVKPPDFPAGIEVFYGQLKKPVPINDLTEKVNITPNYDRRGYGTKLTLGKKGNEVDLIMFHAIDIRSSVPDSIAAAYNIRPAENLTLGVNTKQIIGPNLTIKFEYALSAYTNEIRTDEQEYDNYTYLNNVNFLFTPRLSTRFNKAFNSGINYNFSKLNLGLTYKRVDPSYQTLGTSYLSNDYEEVTTNISTNLFKKKLNLSGNFGGQRKNIQKKDSTTVLRFITSLNATFMVNEHWNFGATFSNFNTSTRASLVEVDDSLHFAQITSNYGGTINYSFQTNSLGHRISLNSNYQHGKINNSFLDENFTNETQMFFGNLIYNLNIQPLNVSFSGGYNVTGFWVEQSNSLNSGPILTLSKQLLNRKLNITFTSTYLTGKFNDVKGEQTLSLRSGINYRINKNNALGINLSYLDKNSKVANRPSFSESRGTINYNYRF